MSDEDEATADELRASIALQRIDRDIRDFKKSYQWREAREWLYHVLERNIPRSRR